MRPPVKAGGAGGEHTPAPGGEGETGQARTVSVEISPSWFFGEDVHGGEKVKGIGSLSEAPDGTRTIIARELQIRGEVHTLRDKRGFPGWQGGSRGRRGPRRFGIS